MSDEEKTPSVDELRRAILHIAASIDGVHAALRDLIRAAEEAKRGRNPSFHLIHMDISSSRGELARALAILVKDDNGGRG